MSEKCPVCGVTFWSGISKEAHKKLYPSHFAKGAKAPAADPQEVLKPKVKKKKGKPVDDE